MVKSISPIYTPLLTMQDQDTASKTADGEVFINL